MGLYIGGGGGALPVPARLPDESTFAWNIAQCIGTDLTLAPTTQSQVGKPNCTEGKRCVGGTNDGQPCLRDYECELGSCKAECFFTSYLAILHQELVQISTCIGIQISEDSSGGLDCLTGRSYNRMPLDARVHLTLVDNSPSTPGWNACPVCIGGTLNVPDSGACEGGPNNGLPCMPMSTQYDLNDCCAGGAEHSMPCTGDSDCPGSTCVTGCSSYPTSLDCPPHPLTDIGGLLLSVGLTTGTSTLSADAGGNLCGWCRDKIIESSLCFEGCFEGDEDDGPPPGTSGCPDSATIACRPATFYGPGGGDPADMVECHDPVPCRTDADCTPPYETCEQRNPGAWRDATIRNATYQGTPAGNLTDRLEHPAAIVDAFCIPPNFDATLDASSDLPGPGGLSTDVIARLSPSEAFLGVASAVFD
jgi:hypothetical protein